jgi:hypothetical protein
MEYLIGSTITLITIFAISRAMLRGMPPAKPMRPVYNQSRIHSMTSPYLSISFGPPALDTQSSRHYMDSGTRIVMYNRNAYWIKDNTVYSADVLDGIIQEDSTKKVDIMSMDKVQLDEMIYIIDMLTEGASNENGSSGNKEF